MAAEALNWDTEIVETHHNQKVYARPAQQSQALAAIGSRGTAPVVSGRRVSVEQLCTKDEIGVFALERRHGWPGTHEVHFLWTG